MNPKFFEECADSITLQTANSRHSEIRYYFLTLDRVVPPGCASEGYVLMFSLVMYAVKYEGFDKVSKSSHYWGALRVNCFLFSERQDIIIFHAHYQTLIYTEITRFSR